MDSWLVVVGYYSILQRWVKILAVLSSEVAMTDVFISFHGLKKIGYEGDER